MKARFNALAFLGLAFSLLPLLTGCTEEVTAQDNPLGGSAAAGPAVAVANTNAAADVAAPSANSTTPAVSSLAPTATAETAVVPAPAPEAEKKLPASLKPTAPAGEVIKLAQAGVEETVMLTYITNSTSMFNLSSDDIIYLNDLGVAGNVITAMIHQDQSLKSYWANQAPPAPTNAAAPTYVNPPQAEPQPAPSEVAAAPQPAPAANVTYNYFYDSLSPYGTWVEVDGYGRCWQPTVVVVNRSWRPYSDGGHWVYTDCGWYWMSDYSWGWAPFHYGRWFSHPRYGWCWWPDRVWAPSWVSWRYSNAYCGWAPLPPAAYYRTGFGFSYYGGSVGLSFDFGLGADCFTFVSWNNFCDRRPWHHRLPPRQVTQVFNHTTIVNNYGSGNNTVINHGIPRERVREYTHSEVRSVPIREHNMADGRGSRGERFANDGKSLIVRRPRIPETATPQMPTAPGGRQVREHDGRTTGTASGTVALREGARGPDSGRSGERPTGQPTTAPPSAAPRPTPSAPSTVNVESPRARGSERAAEISRERTRQSANPASPVPVNPPVATRPAPATPAPVVTPAPVNPTPRENRSTAPRTTEERRETPNRERRRDGSQVTDSTPVVANSPVNNGTPATRTAPPGSLVVIGRGSQASTPSRTETPVNTARNTYNWTPPANSVSLPQSAPAPERASRESGHDRVSPRATYTTPTPAPSTSTPTYSAPAQRSYTPPAPSYNAPRPAAPTYSAPVQRSQPSAPIAPTYRAPAPSPAPSYSPPARSSGSSESRSSSSSSDRGEQRGGGRR